MRRIKLFSLFQERVTRRMCPSRWSARRRASWSASGGSAAVESLEPRCLLAAGHLDPSFGVGGKVTTTFGSSQSVAANGMAVQSDGKIVVAGYTNTAVSLDFALARYNEDGSLDTSFDGDGKVTTDFGKSSVAHSMALQADGKIVVAGYVFGGGQTDFALARYNSDGSLDTSFDGDGKLTTDFGTSFDVSSSLALQADGKIVVVGYRGGDNQTNFVTFALARYNDNGVLDTSFGVDGKLTTDIEGYAQSVALQADGKIIVTGTKNQGNTVLARYNENGSLDTSFDGDGTVTTVFGTPFDYAQSVVLQADGKIVVAGQTRNIDGDGNVSNSDFALARYNSDGTLDTSFDGDGTVTTDFGGHDNASSVALQADGKIVVAGNTGRGSNADFSLARYNSDGSLDTSFHLDGKLTTNFGTPSDFSDYAAGVAVQADGKIVVAGHIDQGNGNYAFALARYSDGPDEFDDEPPTITSANTAVIEENTSAVLTVAAIDQENQNLSYSLSGGADQTFFDINSTSGALSFVSAPNFDQPTDTDNNNVYLVRVQVSDGTNVVTQNIQVTVEDVFRVRTIRITENTTAVLNVSGTITEGQFLLHGIFGGADQSMFSINPFSGALSFTSAPDFENPTDANHDNTYEVTVAVVEGTYFVTQTISVSVTNAIEAPAITSANSVSVPENTTAVMSVAVADPEHDSLSYSLTDGVDQTLFNIDPDSGAVSFKSAPNFENPTDTNHDNVYLIQVQVSDGTNLVTQNLSITVTNVNESPTITSANTASIAENTSFVFNVTGSDPEGHSPLFGIVGGADQAKFTLNFLTGALSFVSPPDFEQPTDANHDNVYEVQVAISDGTHLVTQNVSVTVTVTIPLPASGGTFKSLFLNGQLHLRNRAGRELMTPVTLSSGADVQFNGSNAADRLTLDRSWSRFTGSLTFNGNGGNDQLDARTVSLGVTFNGGDGNDTFLGGSGDDTTNGGTDLDSLSGNDGNDLLTGGDGNDKLFGGAGGDIITGDAGTDSLSGGDDDDSLSGGDSNDTLNGDAGNDTVKGDTGADIINGGDDDDLLFGNAGNDAIDGGRGDDVIDGGDDNDNLKGSDGDDAIRGNNGNDTLSGGIGNDLLTGSAGNDSLLGDDGIDTLLGDAGNDILKGGNGTDTINGVLTGLSRDTISDTTKIIDTSFAFDFDALLAGLL